MNENPERAGRKKVEILGNPFYQSHKYNLSINIFSPLSKKKLVILHCLKKKIGHSQATGRLKGGQKLHIVVKIIYFVKDMLVKKTKGKHLSSP